MPLENLYLKGDYAFDFQRTASRITEMQAQDYQHSFLIAEQA
jgi:predicted ATPase